MLAVVKPSASTRPLRSEIRHCTLPSNTLALPLIVTGDVSVSFVSGRSSVIAPFADVTGDGSGVASEGFGVDGPGESVSVGAVVMV
jgi:hypothetical protein